MAVIMWFYTLHTGLDNQNGTLTFWYFGVTLCVIDVIHLKNSRRFFVNRHKNNVLLSSGHFSGTVRSVWNCSNALFLCRFFEKNLRLFLRWMTSIIHSGLLSAERPFFLTDTRKSRPFRPQFFFGGYIEKYLLIWGPYLINSPQIAVAAAQKLDYLGLV